jgi:hypothetical protein
MRTGDAQAVVQSDTDEDDLSLTECSSQDTVKEKLVGFIGTLMQFFSSDPVEFEKAVDAASKNALSLKTSSSVISALHNFGKKPGAPALSFHGRNRAAIPVQPTALARRKSHFGGRRCSIPGRPPKRSFVGEHGYVKSGHLSEGVVSAFELPHKRAKKPHSLGDCVVSNVSSAKL